MTVKDFISLYDKEKYNIASIEINDSIYENLDDIIDSDILEAFIESFYFSSNLNSRQINAHIKI